ncbi:MAG: hypothetical protein ABDH61_06110 [Acidilobaceae archaeon]
MRTPLVAAGLALLLLVAVGGLVVAAKPWKMAGDGMELEMKGAWKGGKRQKENVSIQFVEIKGKVSAINATKRTFTVVAQDGKSYELRLHRVYVRTSDGVLIFGGWIFNNLIKEGKEVSAVIAQSKRSGLYMVFSITVDGQTYQTPRYYMRG